MMFRTFFALSLAVLLGSGCETTKSRPESFEVYRGVTFELKKPSSVIVANEMKSDFAVHYFRVGASPVQMGIYEGTRPKIFSNREKNLSVMRKGNTVRGRIERGDDVWGVDSNAKNWRESIWTCSRIIVDKQDGKKFKVPSMIHIWYFGASDEEQAVFDAIIESIEVP